MKKTLALILAVMTILSCLSVIGSAATAKPLTFDAKSNLTSYICTKTVAKSDGRTMTLEYTYNAKNQLIKQKNSTVNQGTTYSNTETYTYNANGFVTKCVSVDNNNDTSTTTYKYDKNNNCTSYKYASDDYSYGYTYAYNKNGVLTTCKSDDTTPTIETYTYNKNGNVAKKVYSGNYSSEYTNTYTYDKTGQITKVVQAYGSDAPTTYTYKYNTAGLLSEYSQASDCPTSAKYTYNAKGQCTKYVFTGYGNTTTYTYTYDKNGNRIKETGSDGSSITHTYKKVTTPYVSIDAFGYNVTMSAASYEYTGKAITPVVKIGSLLNGVNYKTYYSNNVKTGKGQIKIVFVDGYNTNPDITITFDITSPKVSGLKAATVATNSAKLTWTKFTNAKYYKVEQSADGKKWSTAGTVTANSITVKSLKAGTKYFFRVTALNASKKAITAVSSAITVYTLTAAPTVTLKSSKSKTATATWKKVTGASKYIVYKSTDGKKYSKAAETTKLTYTLTKLTGGKKIYVKVVAVNAGGKSSSYSKAVSATVKK